MVIFSFPQKQISERRHDQQEYTKRRGDIETTSGREARARHVVFSKPFGKYLDDMALYAEKCTTDCNRIGQRSFGKIVAGTKDGDISEAGLAVLKMSFVLSIMSAIYTNDWDIDLFDIYDRASVSALGISGPDSRAKAGSNKEKLFIWLNECLAGTKTSTGAVANEDSIGCNVNPETSTWRTGGAFRLKMSIHAV